MKKSLLRLYGRLESLKMADKGWAIFYIKANMMLLELAALSRIAPFSDFNKHQEVSGLLFNLTITSGEKY